MPPTPKSFPVGIFTLLIFWLALLGHDVGFGKEKPENQGDAQEILILTEAETAWLKDHQTIHLGIDPRFAPFEFIDKNGRYAGMAADYVQLLNERLGIQMQIVPGLTWNQAVTKAKSGEIDVLPCVGMTAERKGYLLFSEAYIAFPRDDKKSDFRSQRHNSAFFQIQARNGVKTRTGIGKYNKMELNSELIADFLTGLRQGVELRI